MTLDDIRTHLRTLDPALPLIFHTNDGDIGAGYHVTELKHASIDSIDCGGKTASWTETAIQLLDADGDRHMPISTFLGILDLADKGVADLSVADVHVEFAHNNIGKRIYHVDPPVIGRDAVRVNLYEARSICKPMAATPTSPAARSCC